MAPYAYAPIPMPAIVIWVGMMRYIFANKLVRLHLNNVSEDASFQCVVVAILPISLQHLVSRQIQARESGRDDSLIASKQLNFIFSIY